MLCCLALSGCQSLDKGVVEQHSTVPLERAPAPSPQAQAAEPQSEEPEDIWDRIRAGYQLQDDSGLNPRIEQQRLWFVGNPHFVEKVGERSSPYIFHIVERLEARNMPTELALLPMIESAYNPLAYSRAQAVGLWQFIPSTGRNFNLRQTRWYDGRRDVLASTQAALNYLSRLHQMFNGDWLLALAAYNAGEGRVSRAIERNEQLGLPTDYWNLSLPDETRNYVPKLLALAQVVMNPQAYGVNLQPIANEPYFAKVEFKQQMDLSRVAELADLDEDQLYLLNPAYMRRITLDGPKHLLVPTDKADSLSASLASLKPQQALTWQEYSVRAGDNLGGIAARHQVTVATLKEFNQLASDRLRIGQVLSIPGQPSASAPAVAQASPLSSDGDSQRRRYRVKSGDNLWRIAKTHRLSVEQVQRWNNLKGHSLRVGQTLALYDPRPSR